MRAWQGFLKVDGWSSRFKSVDRYLSHYGRAIRSEGTKELCCDVLMRFCKFVGKEPDVLVSLSSAEASELVENYVDSLADRGQSIRTVNVALNFLKTFFRVNGFSGDSEIDVERFFQPSRYRKRPEYIPTEEEIKRMAYSAGSVRNRAMILALYTSGLRNSTLRAVLYGDVKDELWKQEIVRIPVKPEMKRVDSRACKGNISYYSFFAREAVHALREYIEQRRERLGSIEDDEPLFASSSTNVPPQVKKHTLVKKRSLDEIVKRAARMGGIARWKDVCPHCLRKAFERALRNAGLDVKDQDFLMGHVLPDSQDPYYDSTKIEELKTKYARIAFFRIGQANKLEMIKAFAQTLGIENIEVKIQKLRENQEEADEMNALGKIIRQELGINPLKTKITKRKKHNQTIDCQEGQSYRSETKIVSKGQLLPHLNNGWSLVKELRSGKLVVRRDFEYT